MTADQHSQDIPATQKAVVVLKTGKDYKVKVDNAYPVPVLKQGQVLVRLTHTGVCHSDLSSINGYLPRQAICEVPGHEGVGRIVAIHPSVDPATVPPLNSKVGVPLIRNPCLSCAKCLLPDGETHCPHTSFHGVQANGSYQQYITLFANYLIPIPESCDSAAVGPILCGGVTSYKAIKRSNTRAGQWLVISGAGGGLGLLAIQYAVALGIRVIGIDTGDDKRAKTAELGASAFLDFKTEDVTARVLELTGGGAHAVIVLAPSDRTYNQALEFLRFQGTLVAVGLPGDDVVLRIAPENHLIDKDITVRGSMVGTRIDIAEALDFVARGVIKPELAVYPPEEIGNIYSRMEAGQIVGRAVLDLQ